MAHDSSVLARNSTAAFLSLVSLGALGSNIRFHAQTLLLFTCDQIMDTVIPGTAFGVLAALSGSALNLPAQNPFSVLRQIPKVSLWLWLVILQFCVQNQRSAASVQEDSVNKPWRPIPSRRITSEQAERLLDIANIIACALSYKLNVMPIFLVYTCLITVYNDYGGGNKSGIIRNLFCGAGFSCYFGGSLSIAIGPNNALSLAAWNWTATIAFGILATTIHTQDFRDEAGDKARGRHTLVTELGRKLALRTVLVAVSFWSVYTPLNFFAVDSKTAMLYILFGGALLVVALQAYRKGNNELDRTMYKVWCLWIFCLCSLPFSASIFA